MHFSHSVGTASLDRVRVYAQLPGGIISMTHTGLGSPVRLTMTGKPDGPPVRDPALAIAIAEEISVRLRAARVKREVERLGMTVLDYPPHTVRELLTHFHEHRPGRGGEKFWSGDQARMRDFWLDEARWGEGMSERGWADRLLTDPSPAEADVAVRLETERREALQAERAAELERYERLTAPRREAWAARQAARAAGVPEHELPALPRKVDVQPPDTGRQILLWTARRTRIKPLRYLVSAFSYAHAKLRWIGEQHNLSGVDIESPEDQLGPAYTEAEVHQLMRVAPGIDLRLALALLIAWDTGRRIESILQLRVSDLRTVRRTGGADITKVYFDERNDKAHKSGTAVVSATTGQMIERLLATEVVRETRLLLPNRSDLSTRKPGRGELARIQPVTQNVMRALLRAAEAKAGVAQIHGRAWHGVKRRSITVQYREAGGDWGPVVANSGTSQQTLAKIYAQLDHTRLHRHADDLDGMHRPPAESWTEVIRG